MRTCLTCIVNLSMKERAVVAIRLILIVVGMMMVLPMAAAFRRQKTVKRVVQDTASVVVRLQDDGRSRKMSTSAYPVRIQTIGRMVQVQSDYNQILPIYTRSGAFYMAARLNKGMNWIGGLPRGSYFINNRPVTVN